MNRKHTVEEYLKIYKMLKKINSEIEFSSDFIISYPGETNDDFNDTLNLVKKIKFINSYSFIFSPRPGTKAAELKLIDNEISKERLKKIQKYLFDHQISMNRSFEKRSIEVLVENKIQGQSKLFGRNKYLNSVIFDGDKSNIGKILKVKIESSNQNSLFGKIENNKSTYVIPSADYCVPKYDIGGDRYYFGPCSNDCLLYEVNCMFANGRENYCLGRDAHLCAFIDKGIFENYFLVECG